MKNRFELEYYVGGEKKNCCAGEDYSFSLFETEILGGKKFVGKISSSSSLKLKRAKFSFDFSYAVGEKIFSNGFQSWTKTREYDIFEKERRISILLKCLDFKLHLSAYGDYNFYDYKKKEGVIHSNCYTYVRKDESYRFLGALTDDHGFHIFESDVNNNQMNLFVDIEGADLCGERTVFEFVVLEGNRDFVYDRYFEERGAKITTAKPLKGFTSWYNYYQNINEEIICKNIQNFEDFKKEGYPVDIFQIDDGFQTAVGDWLSVDKEKFPNGIKEIVLRIKKNFLAGLWLAPFCCEKKSDIYQNHKEWLLRDVKGKEVPAGMNWSGFYALDIYNEEFRVYLKKVFDTVFSDWGFDLVKLDFLYSACIIPSNGNTRGEVMSDGMSLLRELCKDKLIIGCGVPLSSSFNKVDYCRIGSDVSLDWSGGFIDKVANNESVSTASTMLNSIARYPLNGRAFLNDTDVFILRDDNVKMTFTEKLSLSITNAIFGKVFFTSDDFSKYSNDELFKRLDFVWNLNDCTLLDYCFLDNFVAFAKILYSGNERQVIVNLSEKEFEYFGNIIDKRSSLII